jgi:threonyl-tRNA synthetase
VEDRVVAVRTRDGKDLGTLSLDDLAAHLQEEVNKRS